MKQPVAAVRLRLPRIEKKPKPVYRASWHDFADIRKRRDLQDELLGIIESIERGEGVAEAHYRAGIDRDDDTLLADKSIMHLHLGGRHSDVLVFLIQYPAQVVLLETNSHMHFRTRPAGKNIVALSQSWFAQLEHALAGAMHQVGEAKGAAARKEEEARVAALAASIAAFKARAGLIPARVDINPLSATESSSFLKKRTKKLLSNADITMRETGWPASRYRRRDKSLLVLFFRKEHFLPGFLELQESISTRVGIK